MSIKQLKNNLEICDWSVDVDPVSETIRGIDPHGNTKVVVGYHDPHNFHYLQCDTKAEPPIVRGAFNRFTEFAPIDEDIKGEVKADSMTKVKSSDNKPAKKPVKHPKASKKYKGIDIFDLMNAITKRHMYYALDNNGRDFVIYNHHVEICRIHDYKCNKAYATGSLTKEWKSRAPKPFPIIVQCYLTTDRKTGAAELDFGTALNACLHGWKITQVKWGGYWYYCKDPEVLGNMRPMIVAKLKTGGKPVPAIAYPSDMTAKDWIVLD